MTYIYLVEKCFGDPNKVYIGKTKGSRKSNHKKTYGDQIEYSLIDEVNSLKYKDWEPLETFWIEYFKFLGFTVVNKRKKGGSGSEFQTEETKQKIKKSSIGKPKSLIHAENISKGKKGKPSTFKGHKHNISSIEKIRKAHLGKIYSKESRDKMQKSSIGKPKSLEHRKNMSLRKKNIPKPEGFGKKISKTILQYDLKGNFIKEWSSALEAEKFIKGDVGAFCRGIQKTAGKYIWKFKNP